MTPDLLRACGHALFGDEWQRALARALGPMHPMGARDAIDDSLVRKWSRGARPVPDWVAPVIAGMLETEPDRMMARAEECRRLASIVRAS